MLKEWKAIGGVGTVGLEVVLSILAGLFAGRWLDGKLHTGPYLATLGFLFGAAAAVKAIVRSWKQMQEEAAREEREHGNPPPAQQPEEPAQQHDAQPPGRRDHAD
jgi:F0F1-type ATP synthase assembly protein I